MKKLIGIASLCALALCLFGNSTQAAPGPKPVVIEQPLGGYCCDAYNYRRCLLVLATPVGNPCFCEGQGWGHVCF